MRAFRPTAGFEQRPGAAGRLLILALLLIVGIQPAFGADKPLTFGVFPHLTAKHIVETYRPLADVLEKRLQRPIVIYTARDFKTFVERTRRGEYDILLTAPHLAWLARQDAGYRPLLKYVQPVHGLLLVKADSPFETPGGLHGRTIARPDPLAVVVLALHAELAAHGLRHNIDYQTTDSGTHLNAAMQVINGRADAAMLGLPAFRLMPPELRQQLRVLAETPPLSSLMYLAHPRLGDAEAQAVRQALRKFAASPAGQTFIQGGGYGGFAEADGNELHAFRPYALQVQDMLRAPR
ncbi:MAG: phosphate/phosphite/phosphonate ABC transporter substrate-binding protein [Gammaproteobacteria bacterium]|nr:phosphate/phosphite/phosphonate ABC transporter substrate-binding protein [Gammaproteobacteria bacterium]